MPRFAPSPPTNQRFRPQLPKLQLRWPYLCENGTVLQGLRLVAESGFPTLSKTRNREFWKRGLLRLFTEKKRRLRGQNWLSIHHPWSNGYHHWLAEVLLKLPLLGDDLQQFRLLLPQNYPRFAWDSLRAFPFKEIVPIPAKTGQWVENLHLIGNPHSGHYEPTQVAALRSHLLQYAQSLGLEPLQHPKIYLSRRQAQMRQVSNEAALLPLLQSAGYTILCAEDFNFWQQVLLFAQCQSLISIHGAGLTNLIFMPPHAQVLELIFPPDQVPYNDCYANLCAACGVNYTALAGELASNFAHLPADQQNLSIHPEELQALLSE